MRTVFIKYLIIKAMWLAILAVIWFGLTSGITTLVEFYEMKIAIGQLAQDDTAYLLYRGVTGIKNVIHYLFSIFTLAYVALTTLNIKEKIKLEGELN